MRKEKKNRVIQHVKAPLLSILWNISIHVHMLLVLEQHRTNYIVYIWHMCLYVLCLIAMCLAHYYILIEHIEKLASQPVFAQNVINIQTRLLLNKNLEIENLFVGEAFLSFSLLLLRVSITLFVFLLIFYSSFSNNLTLKIKRWRHIKQYIHDIYQCLFSVC